MQTFNNALKDKQTNTTPVNKTNTGNQASTSILWDAYVSLSFCDVRNKKIFRIKQQAIRMI